MLRLEAKAAVPGIRITSGALKRTCGKICAVKLNSGLGGEYFHYSSRRRLEALRRVSARVVPGGRRDLYQFATFDVLSPTEFESGPWLDLDGESYGGVLYSTSF